MSSTLCLTKVPQHKLSDRYATQTAVGIAGASKMESPTDNVLQGSVRARIAFPLPDIITRAPRERPGHSHQFQTPYCRTNSYRDSFFPLGIVQWNALPSSVACQASLPLFQADLSSSLNPPFLSCFNPLLTCTILLLFSCLQVFLYSSINALFLY